MMFLITASVLALPLAANAQCLTAYQIANWIESGHRYRVQIEAKEYGLWWDTWTMAADYCNNFYEHTRVYINPQCHVQPDKRFVWADLSVAEGGLGLEVLRIAHESAAEEFRATHSGCTTDMSHVV
ncbi:hypothetical protein IQ06DRAFT_308827 [Phaeosphaeriaceae sp. SRC1lsM3a]|nr:hypothetical protein IQ06DRAFT_308827 [Stagonospora sp. SRC1lsM3a]